LLATLDRMNQSRTKGAADSEDSDEPRGIVDEKKLLRQVGDDPKLLEEIVTMYQEKRASILQKLGTVIRHGTAIEVEREAHKLRSTFGNLAADAAVDVLDRLETMSRRGNLTEARVLVQSLDEMTRVIDRDLQEVLSRVRGSA
jgi:HPt (histidine-containing phosphotransfer) domain-containing protein